MTATFEAERRILVKQIRNRLSTILGTLYIERRPIEGW